MGRPSSRDGPVSACWTGLPGRSCVDPHGDADLAHELPDDRRLAGTGRLLLDGNGVAGQPKDHPEPGAGAQLAGDLDVALHRLDERADDVEADAGAAEAADVG